MKRCGETRNRRNIINLYGKSEGAKEGSRGRLLTTQEKNHRQQKEESRGGPAGQVGADFVELRPPQNTGGRHHLGIVQGSL